MASINKVILVGNVGKDPEVKYMPNGNAICTLSIATTRKWTDKGGDKQEETDWHRVVFFERLAEIVGQYLKKGSSAYFEGRLRHRKWTDKDGKDVYTTEVIADVMQMLGGRDTQGDTSAPQARSAPAKGNAPSKTSFDDMEDDIPF